MSAAIGGASAPAKSPHGEHWVDVRDFGAKADDGATDNAGPFQAAIDALIAKVGGSTISKGIVFIPSATKSYFVSKSIWVDSNNIEIQGESWGTRILMAGRHSVFLFGIRRVEYVNIPGGRLFYQITQQNRPDLYGKLDTSAAPSPGSKWGIRTFGNSFVQVQACSMSSGPLSVVGDNHYDNWTETTKLTVEFCIEPPDGQQFNPGTPLLGMGSALFEPSPWLVSLWDEPNKILVQFRTADIGNGLYLPTRSFSFKLGNSPAPYRVAIQIDLDNAVCSAFVNGTQMPLIVTNNLAPNSIYPFAPGSGLRFSQNEHYPFKIGADDMGGPFNSSTGTDLRLYGLRFSNTIRYQNNGAGQPQRRVDSPGTAINDAYAYFGQDANTICFLTCTDDPSTAGRIVSVANGFQASVGGVTSGLFLNTANFGGIIGNGIRNMQILAGIGCGQAISLGGVLEMMIENVKTISAFNAVGNFVMYANYTVYIRDCWLDAYDSPFFGATQLTVGRDNYLGRAGRVALRHYGGNATWVNTFVAFAETNSECIVKIRNALYGGNFHFANLNVDYEGDTLSLAGIYCETVAGAPATSLLLRDIIFGSIGANASLVMLRDLSVGDSFYHRGWISANNIQAFTSSYKAAVDVDGPLWHGEVTGLPLTGPHYVHRGKWGTKASVIVRDTKFTAPPRQYPWFKGAHVLEVRSPSDGQFTEWRCVATGAYGTPQPPDWYGLNPILVAPNGLAAYVLNHAYFTAAII